MKITTRCGDDAIAGLNETLLFKAAGAKLIRTDKVRADTTVVPAAVAYPTDSGLLAKAIGSMSRTVARIEAAGGANRTRSRDRRRLPGLRARAIAAKLKLRATAAQSAQAVRRITGELAGIAESAIGEATVIIRNAQRALCAATGHRKGRLHRAIKDLEFLTGRTDRVVAQTRSRLAGVMPESASRVVSLHDTDARPIRKGLLGKPVEVRYKTQIVDNADGVILDHSVEMGNPADAAQLAPAIAWVARLTGRTPGATTADRGYGLPPVERDLHDLGVRGVAIPRMSKPAAARVSSNTDEPFATRSSVAPGRKDGSTTSSAATAGTAQNSPALTGPEPGAATASSPTTWSRSALSLLGDPHPESP